MVTQLKLNSAPAPKISPARRQIYTVNFSSTVGSEITGIRPALVISPNDMKGEDVTVIPLTSALAQKLVDPYDLLLKKDKDNSLYTDSYIRFRQIRCVSLSRLGKCIGVISDKAVMRQISEGFVKMLALDVEQENPSKEG